MITAKVVTRLVKLIIPVILFLVYFFIGIPGIIFKDCGFIADG
jgi:hypothetical protein